MGGLACMGYATQFPKSVAGLIVVDIAPKEYNNDHSREFQALKLDLSKCRNRQEIDALMSPLIPRASTRRFLQMSLGRKGQSYVWKIYVDGLEQANVSADFAELHGTYNGKTIFVVGGGSPYVTEKDHPVIKRYFPNASIRVIPSADHWLHHTAADAFKKELESFFTS
jgi:pimeloyl-ACP methyl ester carboxylesterase